MSRTLPILIRSVTAATLLAAWPPAAIAAPTTALAAPVAGPMTTEPARQTASQPASAPGFRGIWYRHEPRPGDPEPAYSGGMATFSSHHVPMAIYAEKARKTFFAYGGSDGSEDRPRLQICVAAYDHATGTVTRPTVVCPAGTDPHANPTLSLDAQGHIWVFVGASDGEPEGSIYRSTRAHDVSAFTRVARMRFADPQPWFIPGSGFLLVLRQEHEDGSQICFATSADGTRWSEPTPLTPVLRGCRAVSWRHQGRVGVAFNYHPTADRLGSDPFYIETADAGRTWSTAGRQKVSLPVDVNAPTARVFNLAAPGRALALKDLNFDIQGNPTLLVLMSRRLTADPTTGPFTWMIVRWAARTWQSTGLIESDHLFDSGCLHIEERNAWRLIAPTAPGAEPGEPGGEVLSWTSDDLGRAWNRTAVTYNSDFNHNFVRRPLDAHPGFYGFWADGAVRRPSTSVLYFVTRDAQVYRLPARMTGQSVTPELVPPPPGASRPASQPGG